MFAAPAQPFRGDLLSQLDRTETGGFQGTVGRVMRRRRRIAEWMKDPEQVRKLLLRRFPKMETDETERSQARLWAYIIVHYFLGGKGETRVELELIGTLFELRMKISHLGGKDYEKTLFEPYPYGTVLRSPIGDIARKITRYAKRERLDGKDRTFGKPGRPKSNAAQRGENLENIEESTRDKLNALLRGEASPAYVRLRRVVPDWVLDDNEVRRVLYEAFPKMFTNAKQRGRAARWHYVMYSFYRLNQSESEIARTLGISLSSVRYTLLSIRRAGKGQWTNGKGVRGARPVGRPKKSTVGNHLPTLDGKDMGVLSP